MTIKETMQYTKSLLFYTTHLRTTITPKHTQQPRNRKTGDPPEEARRLGEVEGEWGGLDQPRSTNDTSHVDIDNNELISQNVEGRFTPELKTFCLIIAYILFFAWQVIGLVLYSIRAFETTLTAKKPASSRRILRRFVTLNDCNSSG